MEATLRPYDRGEEVTPFATLGLYHALPCPTILRLSPLFLLFLSYLLCSEGRRGRSKNEFSQRKEGAVKVEPRQRHTRPASTHKCEPTRSLAGSLSPPRMAGFSYCVPGAKNPDGRSPFFPREPGVGDVAHPSSHVEHASDMKACVTNLRVILI